QEIDQTIKKNLPRLGKYGVLTVRPGYEIAKHQLTGRRAIVATVQTKRAPADLPRGEALPDSLGGVPVDVREGRPYQRLRAADPLAAAITPTQRGAREGRPEWAAEARAAERRAADEPKQRNPKKARSPTKGSAFRRKRSEGASAKTDAELCASGLPAAGAGQCDGDGHRSA